MNEYLSELKRQTDEIKDIRLRLEKAEREYEILSDNTDGLFSAFRKETREAEKFEKGNFRSFISGILGTKEADLKRERQQADSAKEEYESALGRMNILREEIIAMRENLTILEGKKEEYDRLFSEKLSRIREGTMDKAEEIKSLEEKMNLLSAEAEYFETAVYAAGKVLEKLNHVFREFEGCLKVARWCVEGFSRSDEANRRSRDIYLDNVKIYVGEMTEHYDELKSRMENYFSVPSVPDFDWSEVDMVRLRSDLITEPRKVDEYYLDNIKRFYDDFLIYC